MSNKNTMFQFNSGQTHHDWSWIHDTDVAPKLVGTEPGHDLVPVIIPGIITDTAIEPKSTRISDLLFGAIFAACLILSGASGFLIHAYLQEKSEEQPLVTEQSKEDKQDEILRKTKEIQKSLDEITRKK